MRFRARKTLWLGPLLFTFTQRVLPVIRFAHDATIGGAYGDPSLIVTLAR